MVSCPYFTGIVKFRNDNMPLTDYGYALAYSLACRQVALVVVEYNLVDYPPGLYYGGQCLFRVTMTAIFFGRKTNM